MTLSPLRAVCALSARCRALSCAVVRCCRASPRPCAPFCVRPRGGCAGHPLGRSVPSGLRVLRLWAPCPLARPSLGPCAPFCVRPRGGCAGHPLGRSVPSGVRVVRLRAPCPSASAALRRCVPSGPAPLQGWFPFRGGSPWGVGPFRGATP